MIRFSFGTMAREWREMRRFNRLPADARSIVFYAEDAGSYVHFEPILRELTGPMGRTVCYLTSSPRDPILNQGARTGETHEPRLEARASHSERGRRDIAHGDAAERHERIIPFYIGMGAVRTAMFLRLQADVMVMTMPDLGTYQIKRSLVRPVHYVYLFHSMVSTHMIYRRGAFDHFDTVLCAGPHHVREIRATEAAYGLPPKNLVEHGYGRLDSLLDDGEQLHIVPSRGLQPARCRPEQPSQTSAQGQMYERNGESTGRGDATGLGPRVLVAPSWGENGLLELHGERLCRVLLDAGYRVTVRPHPRSTRACPRLMSLLVQQFGDRSGFDLEMDMASSRSLRDADVMVSDWSGAALEYAFAGERPVLFVDVPRKVNNPEYGRIDCEPLEVAIRREIGDVVSPGALDEIPRRVEWLLANADKMRERIREVRRRVVFNLGASGAVGAACIRRIADEAADQKESRRETYPCPSAGVA